MSPLLIRSPWAVAALLTVATTVAADEGDLVYPQTAHGSLTAGVNRVPSLPRGSCKQCHQNHVLLGGNPPLGLFSAPDNTLCFACHSGPGVHGVYQGPTAFQATDHWTSGLMLWPGPNPPARPNGDQGLCLNCHTPHGTGDGLGLVPSLGYVREEALCLTCHDGNGPSSRNLQAQLNKVARHPVATISGRHQVSEGLTPGAFSGANRHAECADCHNPHAAQSAQPFLDVSRVAVQNGVANSVPTFVPRSPGDPAQAREYEVCFKCHSSWTTLPNGAHDLSVELNPANASFHPVEGAGRNTTAAMTQSLAGGLGSPVLTTATVLTCSDCHGSDGIPNTVTLVSSYTGSEPTGPHGSSAATTADYSSAILRSAYRVTLEPSTRNYARADFTLCYTCHKPAPFETTSKNSRTDTNFRLHGFHVSGIRGQGSLDGDINTPGSGRGNAICKECHYSIHGTAGTFYSGNRTYSRLVSFSPNITGPGGTGQPSWSSGSCTLRCHGKGHNPETY